MNLQLRLTPEQKEVPSQSIVLGVATIAFLFFNGCVSSKAFMHDDTVKFPKSRFVEVLDQRPDKPHFVIATLETKGGMGVSLPEILDGMRKKAKEIGADAIIPTKDVSEYKKQGFIYNPWLGGYQTLPGGKMPAIQGYAIIYKSTIQKLKRSGYNFRYFEKPFSVGLQIDAVPYILRGYDIAGWVGKDKFRVLGYLQSLNTPEVLFRDGFENGEVEISYGFAVDYFLEKKFKGLWFSSGLGYWKGTIGHESEVATGEIENTFFSFGLGYSFLLAKGFYLSSKFSANVLISGDKEIRVGSRPFFLDDAIPDLAIEFGWFY